MVPMSAMQCEELETRALARERTLLFIPGSEVTEHGGTLSSQQTLADSRRSVVMPILTSKRWKPGKWATAAGVSKNSVYGYLAGERKLSAENRKAMAEALGLTPEQLPE